MSDTERWGTRPKHYSEWHRIDSLQRFVGETDALNAPMIDIDAIVYVEYDRRSYRPIALIEEAVDVGQPIKVAVVVKALAQMAHIPAWTLLYRFDGDEIISFRTQRLHPKPDSQWVDYTPKAWAQFIVDLRREGNIWRKRA